MYSFDINARPEVIQNIANDYDVTFSHTNEVCTVWDMKSKSYNHEYSITKYGNDYRLRSEDGEKWQCMMCFDGNNITIHEGSRNGKSLKAESRLKVFQTMAGHLWALKQVGKID